MPSKFKSPARFIQPDARFHHVLVTKFVNCIMQDGKKRVAYQIFYDAMDEIGKRVKDKEPEKLLKIAEDAIRNKDQALATAAVARYGQEGHPERPVFDLMLKYAVSEDGALHAEKFYRTVSEEFASTRAAFRWRQLIALARVTASEHGFPAPGHQEACELLGLS
jgi:hypothetical protein